MGNRFPRSRILASTDDDVNLDDSSPTVISVKAVGTVAEGEELEDLSASDFAASLKQPANNEEQSLSASVF
jgi:hypothetical protein